MKKKYQIIFLKCVIFVLILMSVNTITAQYSNQVTFSGSRFAVRINGVDSGTESSLGTAINRCIGTGNRYSSRFGRRNNKSANQFATRINFRLSQCNV